MPPQDINARREEARLAMEGEERREKRAQQMEALSGRRAEAAKAMESASHRARREARERAVREAQALKEAKVVNERTANEAKARVEAAAEAKEKAEAEAKQALVLNRIKASQQAAGEIKKIKNIPTHLSSIRTLKTDMAEAVGQGQSIAGAMIAQSGANTIGGSAPARRSHALAKTIFILILLGAMAVGGTLAYKKWVAVSPPSAGQAPSTPVTRPSLVFAENKTGLDVTGKDLTTLITSIRELGGAPSSPQTIKEITFLQGGAPLIFRLWQNRLELLFPDNLTRLVEPTFMFGFYHGSARQDPFIIIQTKSPDQVFSQLLTWEKNLPLVWDKIVGKPPALPVTPSASSTAVVIPAFHDQVIQNLDTRILEGEGVSQPAMYGFLDAQTIILTQTRDTFTEVLTRFRKQP